MPNPHATRRDLLLGALALVAGALPAAAAPRRYRLDPARSEVAFSFVLSGAPQRGTMPVAAADIRIDPDDLAASQVEVALDVTRARTPLAFATAALLGETVLDAARHPDARFVSTAVRLGARGRISDGAKIEGRLSLRGVTRPVSLAAALYRPAGSAPDDLDLLDVRLSGSLSRRDFGATGYANLVADRVDLDIRAVIAAI